MYLNLILKQTIDGKIAKSLDDDLSWGSKEDFQFYKQKTTQIKNLIVGSSTYRAMPKIAFKNRKVWVLTSKPDKMAQEYKNPENIFFCNLSAKKLYKELELKGVEEACVIGGSSLYTSFLKEGLVDRMYITLSPYVFGKGISSFRETDINTQFKLVSHKILSIQGDILCEYEKQS